MIVRMWMAMSPNGYIARLNGEEDWLSGENWQAFLRAAKEARNIVIGRESYEVVKKLYKDYNFDDVDTDYKVIASRNEAYLPPEGYLVGHSPEQIVSLLEERGIKIVLLSGGGKLNAGFAHSGLIDEISLIIEPHIIGRGRQLFLPEDFELPLELLHIEQLTGGRVELLYKVSKS